MEDLRRHPDAVLPALEAITETMVRYARAALEAGADGIFFATQTGSPEVVTLEENARFGAPYGRRVLESVHSRSVFTLLHIHGKDISFDQLAALPVHAVNWHDRITPPGLADAKRRFAGAVAGGLGEWGALRSGPPAAAAAEVEDALRQTGGVGLIVAPGCVLPLDVPDEHLEAVARPSRRGVVDMRRMLPAFLILAGLPAAAPA